MILITGASGKTGRALSKSLSKRVRVCALVHREESTSILHALGVERIVVGDMRDRSVIRSAVQGVNAIYHICPNMSPDEIAIGKLLIDEARKHGVEHFVYHSVLHPQTEKMIHHWQKMRMEEMVFESGLGFTILQPAPYMQNLLANWKSILDGGVLRLPYSVQAKFSFLDLDDLAEAASTVLTKVGHKNAIYELAGTTPMTHVAVAEIFARVLRRDVHAESEEVRDWRLRTSGLSEYARENLVRMFDYYDQWGLAGNSNVLKWLLQREPTSFEEFIQRMLTEHNATP